MKKMVRIILLFILMVSIPSFSYAQSIKKEDVPNGSYIIGTYRFDKNKTANYNGTLTTQMIMLASKSINNTNLNNMIIYFKNSRGKWINAITGKEIASVPASFEITCTNLNCQSNLPANVESFETYTNANVSNGTYIIGNFLFDKNKNSNYNGTLTTQMIMLASKSITSNNLNDMIIYFKNSRGKWVNAINNQTVASVPQTFNISYKDLVKVVTKLDDKITVIKKTVSYDGGTYQAQVTTLSGLTPTITYYKDSSCTVTATPKDAGNYYLKATTAGNGTYNSASLGCTLAVEINKINAVCPTISDYTGTYDKKAHSIIVDDTSDGGTIEYKTASSWLTTNPTRTDAGQTIVYVHVLGDNNHNTVDCGSKKITINKANDKITVKKKSYVYTGGVKTPTITVTSGLTPTMTYYSNSTCTTKTVKNTNSTSNGGAPYAVGTYYVTGLTAGNTNYNATTLSCTEAVTIKAEKTNDEITVVDTSVSYTGSAISASYETLSDLAPTFVYYSNSTCTTKTTTANASSAGGAPIKVGTYYVTGSTTGNDDYNAATVSCTKALTINQRTVSVTAPKLRSGTLTYNGSAQTISKTAGSCSAGGTMYYYTKNYTTSSAPAFDTTNWSTTYPTITATNARTYYLWYYCKVDDTTNNTGTNINTVSKVSKAINKKAPTLSLSATSGTLTFGTNTTATITTDGDGALSCSSSDETVATCSISGKTLTITPKANAADSKKATITVSQAAGTNYKEATDVTYEATVNRKTITCPTSPADKTYTGSAQSSGITCPTGSVAAGNLSAISVGSYAQTCTANAGYKFASTCSINWKINQRTVTITAPKLNSSTLVYNGSAQTISGTAGSCTAGGTMYYYTKNYTTSSAPNFDTTNWSTTYPTITATNARTYYLWYYCKVDDTTNNTGTNLNSAQRVSKSIGKKATTLTLSATSGTLTYGTNKTVAITTDGDGALSCVSSDETVATCSISGKTLTISPKANTADSKKATITVSQAAGTNYKEATAVTYTATVNRKTITCPTSPADKTYTGSNQASGITCPTGSVAAGNINAINVGNYAQTCTANTGYKFSATCSVSWKINQRTVTITAPKLNSSTLTYNGSEQTISGTAGSCSAGGTMYYYTKNYTTSSAPTFDTTNWSTTYPTIKATNARTYYLWYYCKVDDTTNNKGTGINTATKLSKAIAKKATTLSLSATSGTLTFGTNGTVTITTDGDGALSCVSSDETVATCSISGKTLTISPKANTADSKKATITVSQAAGTNYNAATNVTYTATVNRKTITCPTSPDDKTYTGNNQASGITCPTGSTAGGDKSGINAGDYAQTCTANTGYKFASTCSVPWKINKKSSTILIPYESNEIERLTAIMLTVSGDGNGALSCTSSNNSYATCSADNGKITITHSYTGSGNKEVVITIKKAATTNYTATSSTYTFVVKGTVPVSSVSLNKTSTTLYLGGTETLTATVNPTDATDKTITWSSSDTSVATVSSNGKITANSNNGGYAIITATASNGKKATCIVHVKASTAQMRNSCVLTAHSIDLHGGNYYTYAPSVFIDTNNNYSVYIFSCSNKDPHVTRDHIYLNSTDNFVLTPTSGWDSYHNCDPTVVEGNFVYNNKTYKYAIAYTGIDNDGLNNSLVSNRIGLAVSNSLTSGWTKVGSTPFVNTTVTDKWGVGQPSLIYVNDKLILFYTNDTGSGSGMQFKIINPNGFAIESEGNLSTTGTEWMHNADFAYKDNRLYVSFEGPEHRESDPNYNEDIISNTIQIYSAAISNYTSAKEYKNLTWEKENEINPNVSGQARNTNAGLFRKASGELFDRRVAFTATDSGKGEGHFSYEIYQSIF